MDRLDVIKKGYISPEIESIKLDVEICLVQISDTVQNLEQFNILNPENDPYKNWT